MKINTYTPEFNENADLDGCIVYADNEDIAMSILSDAYGAENLIGCQKLGHADRNSWEVQDFIEMHSEYFED